MSPSKDAGIGGFGGWQRGKQLGQGGNGYVFEARRGDVVGAIKLLRNRNDVARRARFFDEIDAMRRCMNVSGVLPLLDSSAESEDRPWFVMGLAATMMDALGDRAKLRDVVEAIRDVAVTLARLHSMQISHRDVKPQNLFRYEQRWCVGDFGIAHFPDKTSKTLVGERVGPLNYIAPEMMSHAAAHSGYPADVYSLGKTLWVLATGQRVPFPHAHDPEYELLRISSYCAEEHTAALDSLIAASTVFLPDKRPTMSEIAAELSAWLAPRPVAKPPIAVDVSLFAARLDQRRAAAQAERSSAQRLEALRQKNGLRMREAFRPVAVEAAETLKAAGLDQVHLNIDNHQWGFDLDASTPAVGHSGARLTLQVAVYRVDTTIAVYAHYAISRFGNNPVSMSVWDKRTEFRSEGSMEDLELANLIADIRTALPRAVNLALEIGLNDDVLPASAYRPCQVHVQSFVQEPIANATVHLVAEYGVYLSSMTDINGNVDFASVPFSAAMAFVSHPDHPAGWTKMVTPKTVVELQWKEPVRGSFTAVTGWTKVNGLSGGVSFIHDSSDRRYMYADNMAIDGGALQLVTVALATPLRIRDAQGAEITIAARAFKGPCFLVDILNQ